VDEAVVYMFGGLSKLRITINEVENVELVYEEEGYETHRIPIETSKLDAIIAAINLIRQGAT